MAKMSFAQRLTYLSRQKSVKYGVPFLLLMVGGSFGLKEFAQLRYQFSRKQPVSPDVMQKYGIKMKRSEEVTLDTEFEKLQSLDIDTWEQKRGPRPWEEEEQAAAATATAAATK